MTTMARGWRRWAVCGGLVVLAGCSAGPGGCDPVAGEGSTTTTEPGTSTTTTEPDGSTTTTTEPDGSTTTTQPGGSTTTSSTVPDGSTTTTTLPGGTATVGVDTLEVEDCFSPADSDTFVDQVRVIDCDTPHTMEVFAQYEVDDDGDRYPGSSELTWAAQDECRERFEDYVGESYWDSQFDLTTLTPSFSTWDVGDRTVTCLIVAGDGGSFVGSARAADR